MLIEKGMGSSVGPWQWAEHVSASGGDFLLPGEQWGLGKKKAGGSYGDWGGWA